MSSWHGQPKFSHTRSVPDAQLTDAYTAIESAGSKGEGRATHCFVDEGAARSGIVLGGSDHLHMRPGQEPIAERSGNPGACSEDHLQSSQPCSSFAVDKKKSPMVTRIRVYAVCKLTQVMNELLEAMKTWPHVVLTYTTLNS